MKRIFGFGSLINIKSARRDIPNLEELKPAFVKGFKRSFKVLDPEGLRSTDEEGIRGVPFCALDMEESSSENKVNGVVFEVSDEYLKNLLDREKEYELISSEAFDFKDGKLLGKIYFFMSGKNNSSYDFESEAQRRYLDCCLEGAKELGDEFYLEFKRTTFIENKSLIELRI